MSENNSPGHTSEQLYQWPFGRTHYEIINCIGHGATSEVFESICLPLNKPCAIKIINLEKCSTSASLEEINKEIRSMKNLRNENIVTYYASFLDNIDLYIVMDLCNRGSLLDVIKSIQTKRDITNGVFDEYTIATIIKDVLRGLAYIHSNDLVHRDLKCGNLLLRNDGVIQIADFGVAGFLASKPVSSISDAKRFTFVGTPCWMAPEVMQQVKGYNQKADIWSLGISTIEMATGQAPYAKFVPMKVLMLTMKNDPPDIDTVATVTNQYISYGMKFRKFCRACLMKDPDLRQSAKELQNHTFIRNKAKERDHLIKTLLNDEPIEPKPSIAPKNSSDSGNRENNTPDSSGWLFSEDSSDDEEDRNQRTTNHSGSQSRQNMKLFPEDENLVHDSGETVKKNPSNQKPTPVTPLPKSFIPDVTSEITEIKEGPNAENAAQSVPNATPTTAFRITLRKRNIKQNNELQDISFSFIVNKDHPDLLARELVEEGLLDGCDLVLVSFHMRELIHNPNRKSVVFPLNSSTLPGQMPSEEELHGYAKVIIRSLTPEQNINANVILG